MRAVLFFILAMSAIGWSLAHADALDIKMLPFLSSLQRNLVAKDYEAAGVNKEKYTLAISPIGAWQSFFSDAIPAEERSTNVLERCEHITKTKCYLVYDNGKMTNERIPRPSLMRYPTEFDPAQVPFINNKLRQQINRAYSGLVPDKALSLNSIGGYGVSYGQDNTDIASKLSLENCEAKAGGHKCFLYSINEKVIFNKDTKIF